MIKTLYSEDYVRDLDIIWQDILPTEAVDTLNKISWNNKSSRPKLYGKFYNSLVWTWKNKELKLMRYEMSMRVAKMENASEKTIVLK